MIAYDLLGAGPYASGFACVPTSPASLNVSVGAGRLYTLKNVDDTAYSTLAALTTSQILKQGILYNAQSLACAAPSTVGFSINYLIQATYQDVDGNLQVLPYYNQSNPGTSLNGPNGTGVAQPTARLGTVVLQAKPGIAAATGTQATPAADAGFSGLWVVTVAFGQTTIVSGNITQAPGAPFLVAPVLTQLLANTIYQPLALRTGAEFTAGVTPANLPSLPGNRPLGDVARYGCVQNGSTSDVGAFVKACKVGGELTISGPMVLASSELAALPDKGLRLIAGTTVRFVNSGSITITGNTPCNLFVSLNSGQIKIVDPFITGNGTAPDGSTGYAWWAKGDASATGTLSNFRVIRGHVSNFGGYYWFYFDNSAGTTFRMQNIRVIKTNFVSLSGNSQSPTVISVPASVIGFSGSDSVNYVGVTDAHVKYCNADGTFIKSFTAIWSGTYRIQVHGNILHNFGTDGSFSDDTGAYAMFAYDHSHGAAAAPDLIEFTNNIVDGVRDAGVYIATGVRIKITGNTVTGQTSTADSNLPKGAYAINQATNATLKNNSADGCALSVTIVVGTGSVVKMHQTTITGITAGNIGVKCAATGTGSVGRIIIDGLTVDTPAATTVGVRIDSNSTIGIATFVMRNFTISTPYTGILQYSNDATVPLIGTASFGNGQIANVSNYGIQWGNCSNAATRATFKDIEFQRPVAGAALFYHVGSTGLNIDGLTFEDLNTGASGCWYGSNAQGRVSNVRFINVADANRYIASGSDLGVVAPAWTGNANDFVQDLNQTQQGSGGSKYMRVGWGWDRVANAWFENRCPTGN